MQKLRMVVDYLYSGQPLKHIQQYLRMIFSNSNRTSEFHQFYFIITSQCLNGTIFGILYDVARQTGIHNDTREQCACNQSNGKRHRLYHAHSENAGRKLNNRVAFRRGDALQTPFKMAFLIQSSQMT